MTLLALFPLLAVCPVQDTRPLPPPIPNVSVLNGSLLLIGRNVNDAEPADGQKGWGLELDGYRARDPLGWELGVTRTSDEASLSGGGSLDATVREVYLGARKTWVDPYSSFHPFASIGLSFVEAEAELSGGPKADDSSFGVYGRGGAYWTFGRYFNIGADVKALVGTDIDFGDANYVEVGVILGYSM